MQHVDLHLLIRPEQEDEARDYGSEFYLLLHLIKPNNSQSEVYTEKFKDTYNNR